MTAPYRRPKLTPGQERAVQLDLFGPLMKLRVREVITTKEAADTLRVSPDFIRDLLTLGKFQTFEVKAKGRKDSPPEYRITVASYLVYLASVSTLSPEDQDDLLATLVDKLDARSLGLLRDLSTRRLARLAGK